MNNNVEQESFRINIRKIFRGKGKLCMDVIQITRGKNVTQIGI